MKKSTTLHALRGATAVCALLSVVSIGASAIAVAWEPNINEFLGTSSTEQVTSDESNPEELYTYVNEDITNTDDLVAWHKDLAEREQEEGSVLLKNNNETLPLANGAKVTLLGNRAVNSVHGGQIGSSPNAAQNISLADALEQKGFDVNPTTIEAYTAVGKTPGRLSNSFGMVQKVPNGVVVNEPSVSELEAASSNWGASITEYSDAAIVVIGRPSSEAADFYPGEAGLGNPDEFEEGENILGLSINEKAIIDYACEHFEKVIVLVNSDSAMELDYVQNKAEVDSILWVGAVGNYGFLGVADILRGEVSPSGHLPDTYAVDSTSSPAMVNFGLFSFANYADYGGNTDNSKGFAFLDEQEGIYTGYRYYETRYEDAVLGRYNATSVTGSSTGEAWNYDDEVLYSFGYGLSYTTFEQELISVSEKEGMIEVVVEVTNTGDFPAKDVVQVYVQTPYTDYDRQNHVEKSAVQLADFAKTQTLAPSGEEGDSEVVTLSFDKKYITSYDYVNAKTYILDAGDYYLSIGNGAHDALNNILAAKGADVDGDAQKVYTWTQDTLNTTTYATSDSSGEDVAVTNQLDDMNLNYWTDNDMWEGQLSRSDWSGTWPEGYEVSGDIHTTDLVATAAMIKELTNDVYSTEGKDTTPTEWGQDTGLTIGALKGADYDDERWDELLSTITLEEAIEFYVWAQNQTAGMASIGLDMQHVQDGPLGFSYQTLGHFNTNEEGDPAAMEEDDANAGYSVYDSVTEPVLGASFNKELLEEQGRLFGTDSLWTNTAILWAPGLNTHRTPYNGRNHEYYSEDPMLTNYLGAAITSGALEYGLVVAPKHFAFNDQESNRTGVSVFMNEQRAREIELRAFQGAFQDAGCMGTMTAFNRAGMRYASAHEGLITNILKKEWGFTGYIVTDMINGPMYMRADTSLMAGTTCLDTSGNETSIALLEAIKDDPAAQNALKDAMHSNLWVLANSNALNGVDSLTKTINVTPWWKATLTAVEVVFIVLTVAGAAGYVAVTLKKKKEEV